jgi:hypothetical protein
MNELGYITCRAIRPSKKRSCGFQYSDTKQHKSAALCFLHIGLSTKPDMVKMLWKMVVTQ